jgi:hypothetical protein
VGSSFSCLVPFTVFSPITTWLTTCTHRATGQRGAGQGGAGGAGRHRRQRHVCMAIMARLGWQHRFPASPASCPALATHLAVAAPRVLCLHRRQLCDLSLIHLFCLLDAQACRGEW